MDRLPPLLDEISFAPLFLTAMASLLADALGKFSFGKKKFPGSCLKSNAVTCERKKEQDDRAGR
jgi:hypothetical protein